MAKILVWASILGLGLLVSLGTVNAKMISGDGYQDMAQWLQGIEANALSWPFLIAIAFIVLTLLFQYMMARNEGYPSNDKYAFRLLIAADVLASILLIPTRVGSDVITYLMVFLSVASCFMAACAFVVLGQKPQSRVLQVISTALMGVAAYRLLFLA